MAVAPTSAQADPWAVEEPPAAPRVAARWSAAVLLTAVAPAIELAERNEPVRALTVSVLVAACLAGVAAPNRDRVRSTLLVVGFASLAALLPWSTQPAAPTVMANVAAAALALLVPGGLGWAQGGRGPRPAGLAAPANIAIPFIAAASVGLLHGAPPTTTEVVACIGLALSILHGWWSAPSAVLGTATAVAAAAVARALAAALLLLVAIPFLYPPGLVSRIGDRRRRRRSTSTWVVRATTSDEDRRRAFAPFAPTPPRLRRRRHLACAAALATVAALAAGLLATAVWEPGPYVDLDADVRFSQLPAYRGVPFADELQREQQELAGALPEDPTTGTTTGTYEGRFTTVSDGVRNTASSTCVDCPSVEVWLTGGSVAFGLGQRDDHTVASSLVRLAAQDGIALEVVNLGVPGWTTWQSARAIDERLRAAPDSPPDLVIDVGGFNDAVAAMAARSLREDQPGRPLVFDGEQILDFERSQVDIARGGGAAAIGQRAAASHALARDAVDALADRAGFTTTYVLHPDALASPRQFEFVGQVNRGLRASRADDLRGVLAAETRAIGPEALDLRHLYDDVEDPLFVDWAHTNEGGAKLLAEAIYREVGPAVNAAARTG